MSESKESWGMVMPFLDGSELYVLGFEAGKVWGLCEARMFPDGMLVHTSNVAQIELVAKHFRCDTFIDPCVSAAEWCHVTFAPRPATRLELVL